MAGSVCAILSNPGFMLISPDGQAWKVRAWGKPRGLYCLTATKSLVIAAGAYGTILTSSDGNVWTLRASGTNVNLYDVACTKDHAVAIGKHKNTILVSP